MLAIPEIFYPEFSRRLCCHYGSYHSENLFKIVQSWKLLNWITLIPISKSLYSLTIFFIFLSFGYPCWILTNKSSLIDYAPKFWNFLASDWLFGLFILIGLRFWLRTLNKKIPTSGKLIKNNEPHGSLNLEGVKCKILK